jgi:hypothetical protein
MRIVLTKFFVGWNSLSRTPPVGGVGVASVVLYGLNNIIPLITLQMLKVGTAGRIGV